MDPLTLLLLLLSSDFSRFLKDLKANPPHCASHLDFPVHRPAVWSEHFGPKLVGERAIHVAPGVAAIAGEVVEFGPPFGVRHRPIRILAVVRNSSWSIANAECGPEPSPFAVTLRAGSFSGLLSRLKKNFPIAEAQGWSERMAFLVDERVVEVAPGIVLIGGQVREFGSITGQWQYPARVLAVLGKDGWSVLSVHADLPSPVPAHRFSRLRGEFESLPELIRKDPR